MDEREAVESLKRGDIGGPEALVRAHQARAVQAAYLILRDRASAEDVAQNAGTLPAPGFSSRLLDFGAGRGKNVRRYEKGWSSSRADRASGVRAESARKEHDVGKQNRRDDGGRGHRG